MKARVKATGEIIELCNMEFDEDGNEYYRDDLELIGDYEPDYWEKLKHQAAITAMQGIINNDRLLIFLCEENMETTISDTITSYAFVIATKLVNKLKEEAQCEK